MGSSFRRQLYYMLYKNFIFKLRNKRQTIGEIVVVLYFVMILAIIKTTSKQDTLKELPESSMKTHDIKTWKMPDNVGYVLQGSSSVLESLINQVQSSSNFTKYIKEEDLDTAHTAGHIGAGLILGYDNKTGLSYTIKMPFKDIVDTSDINADEKLCRKPGYENFMGGKLGCPANTYISSGFALMQSLIDLSFIQILTSLPKPLTLNSSVRLFPKAEFTPSTDYLKNVVSIYMNIAFAPYILFLLTNIVTEKEKKIKESMKIMGLNMTAYWLSWFITYAIVILIGCILTTAISSGVKLFNDSDFFIIFLLLFFYGLSIITLSFMLTTLFQKAKTAGFFGALGTIILSTISLVHIYADTTTAVKWLTSFLSPVALSLGLIAGLDSKNPVTFSNFTTVGDFPPIYSLIMLFLDTVLYLLLAIYLDAIFPGEYGKPKHPLFLFAPSFWQNLFNGNKRDLKRGSSLMRSPSVKNDDNSDVEDIPEELLGTKVISINNLRKRFKQGKKKPDLMALDGVTLDVFEGQITALLGHNGAGKSTLISTLTGMLSPSGGSAELYGLNIKSSDEMDDIRQIIGLCPQQNIIFEQLNAREHLTIYAGIKGLDKNTLKETVDQLLREIDLADHATTQSQSLSGGQQRKLCVGIALIGNPKIVFLDEPTSGMDPSSRRRIWSLLQSRRENRVVFLTTHFMDEADILADYKAIMSKGKIRCAGSSLFLKNRYGIGYHLGMVVDKDSADVDKIKDAVTRYVPGSQVSRMHGKELAFRLPLSEAKRFPDLFKYFEESNESKEMFSVSSLGVTSYGVSMTTLEEVFLKLEDDQKEDDTTDKTEENNGSNKGNGEHSTTNIFTEKSHLTVKDDNSHGGSSNLYSSTLELNPIEFKNNAHRREVTSWMQFMALMEVRFWQSVRSPTKMIFQVIIPPILLIVGVMLLRNLAVESSNSADSIKLEPSLYLKQGSATGSNLKEVIWMLQSSASSGYSAIKQSFADIELQERNVSTLDLFKVAPHVVAYDIGNYSSEGQVGYNLRYNDTKVHSIPVGINTISNAMYHIIASLKGMNITTVLPITVFSKPFKSLKAEWKYDAAGQVAVMLIGLSFAQMAGGFAVEPVYYRQLGIRHQLRVSGTSRIMYWLHFLVGDMMFYILPVIALLILIPAVNIAAFNMGSALGAIFLLLLLYIPSSLLFTYTLSFMFTKFESAQNAVPTLVNMAGIVPYYVVSIIDMVSGSLDSTTHVYLATAFAFIDPPFIFFGGLYYIARAYRIASIEAAIAGKETFSVPASKYFEWNSTNALPVIYLAAFLHIVVFSWSTIAIDCYKAGGNLIFPLSLLKNLKSKFRKRSNIRSSTSCRRSDNEDVKKEKEKVINCIIDGRVDEKSVLAQGLCKQFKGKKVVKEMNMMVNRGEIFGILGPNGAGKTTTLNMVTADLHPDKGQIFVDGNNVETHLVEAFQSLGYCPQSDSLWELLSIKEHLKCYGLIKGVPPKEIDNLINHYARVLKIEEHLDKRSKQLSGGTKRKLSFLMSMIGDANVIIMDEPSCGMDPGARRFLWTAISSNTVGDRGVILTTHSMEEADALCARVGIMVKGELKCVGTTQELKTNYGGGYQLEIKFKTTSDEPHERTKAKIADYVRTMFPHALEIEYFGSRVTYKIPMDEVKNLSVIFSNLEAGKADVNIEEYSFSQSTLEQVFLEFAKEQDADFTGKESDEDENVEV